MIDNNKGKKYDNEITTDTEGIYMRDYQDITREIPNHYGYYDNAVTFEMELIPLLIINAHNPMELYEANKITKIKS